MSLINGRKARKAKGRLEMISVTERAKEEMKKVLVDKVNNPLVGLRLNVNSPGDFSLSTDIETPGDQVVKHEGMKVLLVGKEWAAGLDGYTLDFEGKKKFVVAKGPLSGFNTSVVKLETK
jgi:Fe-S cluster assembly iron-binding protein IscA